MGAPEKDKTLAKVILSMSKKCTSRPRLAYHLKAAADAIWRGDGYASNGSAEVENHLAAFNHKTG